MIVVDNGSTDDTPEAVRAAAPRARVIANPANRGLPAANNQGIDATDGEFVLIANPDTLVRAGAVDSLVETLRADSGRAFGSARPPARGDGRSFSPGGAVHAGPKRASAAGPRHAGGVGLR